MRWLPRCASLDNQQILGLELGLQEVQRALARDHGFEEWNELMGFVSGLIKSPDQLGEEPPPVGTLPIDYLESWQLTAAWLAKQLTDAKATVRRFGNGDAQTYLGDHRGTGERASRSDAWFATKRPCDGVGVGETLVSASSFPGEPPRTPKQCASVLLRAPGGGFFGVLCLEDWSEPPQAAQRHEWLERLRALFERDLLRIHQQRFLMSEIIRLRRDLKEQS